MEFLIQASDNCARSVWFPLHEVTDFLMPSINSNHKLVAIFLDLNKAFDTIHRLLPNRVERFGICGNVLNLFTTYLCDRTQKVKIGNSSSFPWKIEFVYLRVQFWA